MRSKLDVNRIGVGTLGPSLVMKEDYHAFGRECQVPKTGHFQAVCTQENSSSSKSETAGSITIQPIVPDDLVQLGVSPASQNSTILLHLLLDSGAFIEAILADMSWSHMKNVLFVNGGTNIVMATGATIS